MNVLKISAQAAKKNLIILEKLVNSSKNLRIQENVDFAIQRQMQKQSSNLKKLLLRMSAKTRIVFNRCINHVIKYLNVGIIVVGLQVNLNAYPVSMKTALKRIQKILQTITVILIVPFATSQDWDPHPV